MVHYSPDSNHVTLSNKNYNKDDYNMVSKEKAFEIALENRKFEIELYWKRAKYFFDAFLALGGVSILISVLQISEAINLSRQIFFTILFAVECVGLVCAIAWSLVNEGSKYWQENWEQYVDALGKDFVGPLFKHPIEPTGNLRRYSVSEINRCLSWYIVSVWIVVILVTIATLHISNMCICCILFSGCSLVAICYMFFGTKRRNNYEKPLNLGIQEYLNAIGESVGIQKSPSGNEEEQNEKTRRCAFFSNLFRCKKK